MHDTYRKGHSRIIRRALCGAILLTLFSAGDHAAETAAAVAPGKNSPPTISCIGAPFVTPAPQQLKNWIRQLRSDQYAVRKAAIARLIRAGTDALPPLRMALVKYPRPQLKAVVHEVRVAIELAQARNGPLITFNATDASVHNVIKAICRQAGLTATFSKTMRAKTPHLTVHLYRAPLWEVLRQIAGATGIGPLAAQSSAKPFRITFGANDLFRSGAPVCSAGRAALAISTAHRVASLSFEGWNANKLQRGVYLQSAALWVPLSKSWVYSFSIQVSSAMDDHGHQLIGTRNPGYSGAANPAGGGQTVFPFQIQLNAPAPQSRLIRRLSGNFVVRLSLSRKIYTVPDLFLGPTRLVMGKMALAFSRPVLHGNHWVVNLDIHSPFSSTVSAIFENHLLHGRTLVFRGRAGRKFNLWGGLTATRYSNGNKMDRYAFHITGGKPVAVSVIYHGGLHTVKIPFVFRNIVLPR